MNLNRNSWWYSLRFVKFIRYGLNVHDGDYTKIIGG